MLGAHQLSSASTLRRTINSVYDSFIEQLICWPYLFLRHNFGVSAPLRHYFCHHTLEGISWFCVRVPPNQGGVPQTAPL